MKTIIVYKRFFISLFIALLVTACSTHKEEAHQHDEYTCPMHPTVLSDKPGACPVCGMDLVLKGKAGQETEVTPALAKLIDSPNEVITSSINTVHAEHKLLPLSVEAEGVVTYDTRQIYTIPARIGGRLEKVYLKYTFQSVTKGQKIAEIYSPELLTVQRELLYLTEHDPDNLSLIEGAKNKLYLLGASVQQVDNIMKSREAIYTFGIYSPYSGYVVSEGQPAPATSVSSPSASTAMGGGMNSGNSEPTANGVPASKSTSTFLREGTYVSTGQTLFKVVNTNTLRIELDVPGAQAGAISVNDDVQLTFDNGLQEKAKVDFIQPFFTDGQSFVKIRTYTSSKEFKVGQLVRATITLNSRDAFWLPKESILDMGIDQIVFIKVNGVFAGKKITTGIRSGNWTEVGKEISSSDEIAVNAQYLVDSESFIKIK